MQVVIEAKLAWRSGGNLGLVHWKWALLYVALSMELLYSKGKVAITDRLWELLYCKGSNY